MSPQYNLNGPGVGVQKNIYFFFSFNFLWLFRIYNSVKGNPGGDFCVCEHEFLSQTKRSVPLPSLRLGHFSCVLILYLSYCPIIDFCRRWPDFQGLLPKKLVLSIFQAVYFKSHKIKFLPIRNQVENTDWGEKYHLGADNSHSLLI